MAAFLLVFHLAIVLLSLVPIGAVVQGQPLKDGSRLTYRCNGMSCCRIKLFFLTYLFEIFKDFSQVFRIFGENLSFWDQTANFKKSMAEL